MFIAMPNPYTPKAPAGRHVSEILAVRITHEKADNALEDVLTQLGLNGKESRL